MGLTSDSDACDGPAGAERGDATEADIATRKKCDKLLVLCRKQWGGPNRMRKLSDESVKFGWTATGLEAKQVKGGLVVWNDLKSWGWAYKRLKAQTVRRKR